LTNATHVQKIKLLVGLYSNNIEVAVVYLFFFLSKINLCQLISRICIDIFALTISNLILSMLFPLQVVFRAKVGKHYLLPHKGIIPRELGVVFSLRRLVILSFHYETAYHTLQYNTGC
jgi:hypothetical protein